MTDEKNEKLAQIPKLPGVYIMRDAIGNIIYIGKAISLRNRISSYFSADVESKSAAIITAMRKIDYILCASEREALLVERQLINKIKPYFNSLWKDDKSYPYIKLSSGDDFPRLFFTRKKLKDNALYFGPYPQVFYIKKLVRWLCKLFKIRPCKLDFSEQKLPDIKKVKSCIYAHTNLCEAPCMGKISSKDYKEKIKDVEQFLDGKFKKLTNVWREQMKNFSGDLEFEKAAEIRDRLYAVENMSERVMISQISQEDMMQSVERADTLNELRKILRIKKLPAAIEGFDNSNIQGTSAVASMVRFTNGISDKKNYRRFKIKTVVGADDFASMKEVVFRRYSSLIRKNEKMPDLILIDGGKGQLSAAVEALDELKLKIPIISLAKKNEEIYFPQKDAPLILSKNSKALRLLQSIRDESHRFAINYHRLLRKKSEGF
ncbi:MAG: excinuclease ABC subunit UvrC [Elusimicrobiota bacterium]|jgi:excinuclease ABC subunit C|nr:excinuclease ABC subunit UvrC [Elusimicrobiota bacterium]